MTGVQTCALPIFHVTEKETAQNVPAPVTTYYWVPKVQEAAKEHGIPFKAIHVTEKETAQNVPAPVTTYALFRDGKFVTQGIQSDKKFLKLAGAAD